MWKRASRRSKPKAPGGLFSPTHHTPASRILNPIPYTVNAQPFTLNNPPTLNLEPWTSSPKPRSINPKPHTIYLGACSAGRPVSYTNLRCKLEKRIQFQSSSVAYSGPSTRWSSALSSKVKLHQAVDFTAVWNGTVWKRASRRSKPKAPGGLFSRSPCVWGLGFRL